MMFGRKLRQDAMFRSTHDTCKCSSYRALVDSPRLYCSLRGPPRRCPKVHSLETSRPDIQPQPRFAALAIPAVQGKSTQPTAIETSKPLIPHSSRLDTGRALSQDVWSMFNAANFPSDCLNLGQGYMDWRPPQFVIDAADEALKTVAANHYSHPKGRIRQFDRLEVRPNNNSPLQACEKQSSHSTPSPSIGSLM